MSASASQTSSRATDAALIRRLRDVDDNKSWDTFYQTYWRLIYRFACDRGLTDAEARDVVQDTMISVARSLHSFTPDLKDGSFRRWLLRLTGRRTVDRYRRRPREVPLRARIDPGTGGTGTAEGVADPGSLDPAAAGEAEWKDYVLKAAMERLMSRVSPRDYQVFQLTVIRQEPATRVAGALGLNRAHVYLVKHRVLREFKRMLQVFARPD